MKDGWIRGCACSPKVIVADPVSNTEEILKMMDEAVAEGNRILVFPELSITAYTCGDLFAQEPLLRHATESLGQIIDHSKGMSGIFFVGYPFRYKNKL